MARHFVTVLISCCVSCVEYMLPMQCYIAAILQHLTAAENYSYAFSTFFIPILSAILQVLNVCCTCNAARLLIYIAFNRRI